MNVGWLLDGTLFEHYHDELVDAIQRNGCEVVSINRPNPPYSWEDVNHSYRNAFPQDMRVITHADIDLVNRVVADGCWQPGAFASVENFFCSHYYPALGKYLLNQDYIMLPFGELKRCEQFLFETLGKEGQLFLRPDSPLKLFTGQTAARESFDKEIEFMGFYEFPLDSLVVVSSPKTIRKEWRFVVVSGKVVAGSQYKEGEHFDSKKDWDQNAHDLASTIAASDFSPDPAWVLDVCQTADNKYHLLEVGAFSYADLYSCDKNAVVKAVSEVVSRV